MDRDARALGQAEAGAGRKRSGNKLKHPCAGAATKRLDFA
ncbi:hypothetical protein BSU04_10420 [Caballeronia sordidicola]|uniref:Uncharacterized protein n=1 Tax=Caballeronia sordidicola TaxID=196367 RepID=A0A226X5D9_CABSO|nr:hypothetical protein BSU04_10420 [Caballeronia sordidicola]